MRAALAEGLVVALLVAGTGACGSSGSSASDSGSPRDDTGSSSRDAGHGRGDASTGDKDTSTPVDAATHDAISSSEDAADATSHGTQDTGTPHDASHSDSHVGMGDSGALASGLHTVNGTGGAPGHILDGANNIVKLHGADRSGTEFACTYESGGTAASGYSGFFDGLNDQVGVEAMASWHINAVRVPLNEDCWLGINGYPYQDTAAHYQTAITQWVSLLNANGMVAILDLHWAAPGTEATSTTIGQLPMADADHAPAFWTSVATAFKSNSSVIFDLFNEPYITDWTCWTEGATAASNCAKDKSNNSYAVAGMANLLKAVRGAGANNVVILGGLGYSSDFTSWVSSVQSIPTLAAPLNGISLANVAASWHAYDFNSEQSGCPSQYNGYTGTCNSAAETATNTDITAVLAAGFPLVIGELGLSAYSSSTAASFSAAQITDLEMWLDNLLTWAEGQGESYVGWSWNTDTAPLLITDYTTGAPTPDYGVTYKAHLGSL
jgi:hypothetical protein